MNGTCWLCGASGTCETHHAILGSGKRKQHETPESLYVLCVSCHRAVHGRDGHELIVSMKRHTQGKYFAQGITERQVRVLMGGKLVLDDNGEIWR